MAFLRAWVASAVLLAAAAPGRGAPAAAPQFVLEAVDLVKFAQFVEWPAGAFGRPDSPAVIGVVGIDPFGANLDDAARGQRIAGRPIEIRRFRESDDVGACQILFVSNSLSGRLYRTIARLRNRPVLTVSDSDNFCWEGGMVRFGIENNRIHWYINRQAARAARLTIAANVLELATPQSTGGP